MKKYNIEGNIDFFAELYKSLDDDDNKHKVESDNNLCLITNQLLIDKFVELTCGHKFNYIPLYNDIYNHKKKFNLLEGSDSSLKLNEIRCPYCRKKQIGVLPYYEEIISEKNNGVNFYDDTQIQNNNIYTQNNNIYIHSIFSYGKCEFILPPTTISLPSNTSSCTNSFKCPISYVTKFDCDNKTYCCRHIRIMKSQFIKDAKNKEKENQKKLKEEIKQKKKEEVKLTKESLKKSLKDNKKIKNNLILSITENEDEENTVVSSPTQPQTNNEKCIQIIKTGPNKGNPCGLDILNDCLCKRHYNLKNQSFTKL